MQCRTLRAWSALPAVMVSGTIVIGALPASGDIFHNEAIQGDLSGNPAAPTAYTLPLGVNTLIATSVRNDLEYVALTIPAGRTLSSLMLASYTSVDPIAFIAVQSGAVFTEPPTGTNVANLLGWAHFGPAFGQVGTDILDDIGAGGGAIGFTPPLPAGTYTFWIQQTGTNSTDYQLDFVVVPAPGVLGVSAAGFALAMRRRRVSN